MNSLDNDALFGVKLAIYVGRLREFAGYNRRHRVKTRRITKTDSPKVIIKPFKPWINHS